MPWYVSWPALALTGYCLVYLSLYAGCRLSRAREASAVKMVLAALLPAVAFNYYLYSVIIGNWEAWHFLPSTVFLLPYVLLGSLPALLLGAPWFLRPADGRGWGRAWAGAAIGGVILPGLVLAAFTAFYPALAEARATRQLARAAKLVADYDLPEIPGTEIRSRTSELERTLLEQRRQHPAPGSGAESPDARWPCNERLAVFSDQEPPQLAAALASALAQAGYEVRSAEAGGQVLGHGTGAYTIKPRQIVTGYRPGVFVEYECDYVGSLRSEDRVYTGTNGTLRIWLDFAEQMRAESAPATAGAQVTR